jgi:hypothetical protein
LLYFHLRIIIPLLYLFNFALQGLGKLALNFLYLFRCVLFAVSDLINLETVFLPKFLDLIPFVGYNLVAQGEIEGYQILIFLANDLFIAAHPV